MPFAEFAARSFTVPSIRNNAPELAEYMVWSNARESPCRTERQYTGTTSETLGRGRYRSECSKPDGFHIRIMLAWRARGSSRHPRSRTQTPL